MMIEEVKDAEDESECLQEARDSEVFGPVVIVGGCGHVGLPLGMSFAKQGMQVDLLDVGADRVAAVNRGEMPFFEEGAEELLPSLVASGQLRATTDQEVIEDAAAVIVTIGTPVDEHANPSLGGFMRAMGPVLSKLRPGQLLILRSTVFPGMTDRLATQLKEMGCEDVQLAYCPERIVQGKSLVELERLPQIIGGVTEVAAQRSAELFRKLGAEMIFVKPIEAELSKLFCNAYRYLNFAVANQFYLIAQQYEADFHEVYRAVRHDYPRMQSFPRPGFAAGPCLVKDTIQLGAFHQGSFPLGQAALSINEGLPWLIVQQMKEAHPLRKMTVGVLGMAFKPNCDDPRDSLSYKLRRVLQLQARRVLCTDPYVPDASLEPLEKVLAEADIIVVATPHDCYRNLKCRQPVFDMSRTVSSNGDWQAVLNGYGEHHGSLDGFYRVDAANGNSSVSGHSNGHAHGHKVQVSSELIDYVI